jgi:hypothetical protein
VAQPTLWAGIDAGKAAHHYDVSPGVRKYMAYLLSAGPERPLPGLSRRQALALVIRRWRHARWTQRGYSDRVDACVTGQA